MADAAESLGERLAESYPALHEFLAKVVWPGADGPNLLELLHRVMRYWHPETVAQLVRDLDHFGRDGLWSPTEVVEVLTAGVPEEWRFVDETTARPLLTSLASFARYLFDDCGLRGTT